MEKSADRFMLLEQRMSGALSNVGFSASRERSQPGAADLVSPRGTPGKEPATTAVADAAQSAPPPFASLASAFFKRKRAASPAGVVVQDESAPPMFHVRTPSPTEGINAATKSSSGGATTQSPRASVGFGAVGHPFSVQQQTQQLLQNTQQELAEAQQRSEGLAQRQEALAAELEDAKRQLAARDKEIEDVKAEERAEAAAAAAARSELDMSKAEVEASKGAIEGMRQEIKEIRTEQEAEVQRQAKGREALREALRERCFRERAATKERLARESVRLGTLEPDTKAFGASAGGWVQRDGTALVALAERERALEARRTVLEEDKKELQKRKRRGKSGSGSGAAGGCEASTDGTAPAAADAADAAMELADLEESLSLRASLLSKDRAELLVERKRLEREAQDHFHELRRMAEFEAIEPELRACPSLPLEGAVYEPGGSTPPGSGAAAGGPANAATSAQRFVFLDLIAQGGFASVFRAYDLQRHTYTACKLHRMSDGWADARKEAFVRHVEREMEITVGVRHHRIVDTYAAFEVASNTVVSVMTYCNGGSLAELLRKHGPLTEKDGKSIMLQMLCGLRYLHSRADPIIHYDLKPANILFHEGEVKLSDFGLSKVMAGAGAGGNGHGSAAGMELTSYGSGTHGYLPPECYDGDASRVCPKVDVFSAGVVHFLMLFYPHKPFFKQATQQQIMQMKSHAIRQETEVLEFPGKVSADGQAFLRRALAPRREERPGVVELLADPYLTQATSQAKGGK